MIGPGAVARPARALVRRLRGDWEEDAWGFDEDWAAAARPLLGALHDRWWRLQATGTEHVPAAGPVLLVANHAGPVPWDAAMVATVLHRAWADARGDGPPRALRFQVDDAAFALPGAGPALRRLGAVPARGDETRRLLESGHAVLAFPEGPLGTRKAYRDRYRLQRFGRGGFAETALRTGAPVVPCAIVGSEEAHPRLGELPALARLLRLPGLPVTPTFPLLGPLGVVPLPAKWRIAFGAPVETRAARPGAADDRGQVLELADDVRARVQDLVAQELIHRAGAFV